MCDGPYGCDCYCNSPKFCVGCTCKKGSSGYSIMNAYT